jgi:drug/metabolite transporter (DMT)-like permease
MNHPAKVPASSLSIWAGMIAVYIAWGSTYLAIRFAIETIPPHLMAGLRFLIAGSLLYLWRRLAGDKRPTRIHWRSGAVVGLLLLLGGNGLVVWAEQHVASGIAALLVGSAPLWMILFDAFRPGSAHKRPGWVTMLGVLVGFVGILVLVGPSELTGLKGDIDLVGALTLTLAAFFWALGSLYSREAELPESPLMGTSLEMLCGGAGLLMLGTATGQWSQFHLADISLRSFSGLLYLIIFGSLIGFGAYTWLLRVAPTSLVSTYAYVNPLVAIFVGNLLAKEPITPRILLAAAVIIGAVVLITLTQPANGKTQKALVPAEPGD